MRNRFLVTSINAAALIVAITYLNVDLHGQNVITKKTHSEKDSIREALTDRVATIFERSCSTSGCHGGKRPKAHLSLERDKLPNSVVAAKSIQVDSLKLVDPENPGKSYLLMKIRGDDGIKGRRMPIARPKLSAEESNAIELWIKSLKKGNLETN